MQHLAYVELLVENGGTGVFMRILAENDGSLQ